MVILPKTTYKFNVIYIRIPVTVFHRITSHSPEIYMEYKRHRIAKAILGCGLWVWVEAKQEA